jgi:regulator of RNase E activity RraA
MVAVPLPYSTCQTPDVEPKLWRKAKKTAASSNEFVAHRHADHGDLYVADAFGKMEWGTLIGDNLGNSIYAKSKNGWCWTVPSGIWRDIRLKDSMPLSVAFTRRTFRNDGNRHQRTDPHWSAVVMPGDVVLAKKGGILFIPATLPKR